MKLVGGGFVINGATASSFEQDIGFKKNTCSNSDTMISLGQKGHLIFMYLQQQKISINIMHHDTILPTPSEYFNSDSHGQGITIKEILSKYLTMQKIFKMAFKAD